MWCLSLRESAESFVTGPQGMLLVNHRFPRCCSESRKVSGAVGPHVCIKKYSLYPSSTKCRNPWIFGALCTRAKNSETIQTPMICLYSKILLGREKQ